jgi:inorganic pyrophosphatase
MNPNVISAGKGVPDDVNIIIEIPAHSDPIKYEIDKDSGALFVDRFVATGMRYPCNYGYIPNTLSEDGDPVDGLVITPFPIVPGAVVRARPIALLKMEDESGFDNKILAVPVPKLSRQYDHIVSLADVDRILISQIDHFFSQYKNLEPGKWVKITGWEDLDAARDEITKGIARFKAEHV